VSYKEKTPHIERFNDFIVYNIGRLYILLNQYLGKIYRELGLNPAKFNLLMLIKHMGKGEGISQIELGDKLFVSASNITKLIDGLEAKNLVERLPAVNDRRIKLAKITGNGLKLLDEVWVKHVEALNNILQSLSGPDKEQFHLFLDKFRKEMEKKVDKNG